MDYWKKNLWVLWSCVLLSSASYTMVIPFLPLYLLDLGVSHDAVNMWSGLVFSVTFLIGAVMAPYWGARADKYGKRKMVIRAGLSLAVVYFCGSLVRGPLELLAVRILQGVAVGFVPASMAIVASSVPESKMGWSLGVMQTGTATGGILGPLFGGVLAHFFGMRSSFVVASVVIFLATIAVAIYVKENKSAREPEASSVISDLRIACRNRALLGALIMLMVVQMVIMVLQPLITLYVAQLQGQLEGAMLSSGIIFSLTGIAGIVAAPSWGKVGQNIGFYKILSIALLGAGTFNILQLFVGTIWQFSVVQFIFGLFIVGSYPAINSIVVENTEVSFRGRAFGLTASANQLGGMIGPLLGGVAGSWMNIKYIFVSTGILLLLAGFAVSRSILQGKDCSI